jgi:hypothetical protein
MPIAFAALRFTTAAAFDVEATADRAMGYEATLAQACAWLATSPEA